MNQNDLKTMYGSIPESFSGRIRSTLAHAAPVRTHRKPVLRVALAAALIMTLMLSCAAALFHSQVAQLFGWRNDGAFEEELLSGRIDQQEQSLQAGDVIYTLQEVVYVDNGLYGAGRITPANDTVVLMAEDYQVTDAAGYGLYYGPDSRAPEGAPTYADLALQKNARILQVHTVPEAVGVDGGTVLPLATAGYSLYPQTDGSVQFVFEIPTGVAVEEGDEYLIRLWTSSWEVTPDGKWLREEPNDTCLGQYWDVIVTPKPAEEMK